MRYLLQDKKYYKANLHTHTTVSDGKLTPEETKALYKEQGYSILALTDHSVTVSHQYLNDPDFLLLTGVEIDATENKPFREGSKIAKCRHMCLIAKEPDNLWLPYRDRNPKECSVPYFDNCVIEGMSDEYTTEAMNAVIAKANEKGFLVTYNHPVWSLENYADYAPMKGLWGMEYRNSGCIAAGYDENNGHVYQDLLHLGNRIVPVCADDMHRVSKPNGMRVLGASWVMIGAEKLEYSSVIAAMERGDLYASCGPEIYSVSIDGDELRIRCSEAVRIQVVTHSRHAYARIPQAPAETLTEAEVKLEKFFEKYGTDPDGFVRIIVTDAKGDYAVTRAYWMDELK